jgi:hypothetical protein
MNFKTLFSLSFFFFLSLGLLAQVTEGEDKLRKKKEDAPDGWKKGAILNLNLAQTSLTNWAAGGQNSIAINGLLSSFANYKKGDLAWDNSLDIGYGLLKQGKNADFIKTDDKFDFLSKYGQQAYKHLYYAALLNFKTQMTVGKDYANGEAKISNLLAPAYVLGAIGMDYKPNSYFSAFVAPFTGKFTIVNDQELSDAGAFGIEPGTLVKSELGGYVRVIYNRNDFKNEILKNVALTSKIDLFSNYLNDPQNIDISWENQIALKVNKYITVNFNTHLIYDNDIMIPVDTNDDGIADKSGPRTQFKEILGVGFSFKF